MKKITIITLAVIFLASCQKENSEINPNEAQSGLTSDMQMAKVKVPVTRPFSANFYTTVDTDPLIPLTPCTGDIPGFALPGVFIHGNATHMGALNAQLSRIQDVSCNLSTTTFLLTTSFTGQLAAANGDLIYVSGDDVINAFNYLTGFSTTGTIAGTWNITGGTGRFDGATGSFTISGPVDFATTSFSCTCLGTITY